MTDDAAPKCTCPRVDVTTYGGPAFMRGDPAGCEVHGVVGDDEIEAVVGFVEDVIGIRILPWQRRVLIHALELRRNGATPPCTPKRRIETPDLTC